VEFVVDLEKVTVLLHTPSDTERFAVRVVSPLTASQQSPADVHRLGDVLVASHVGRLDDGGDAFVDPRAVEFHAAGQVGGEWDQAFAAMCRYAGDKGWVDESDGFLQAHIIWPDGGDQG
jgi:hypothetical protein